MVWGMLRLFKTGWIHTQLSFQSLFVELNGADSEKPSLASSIGRASRLQPSGIF